MLAVGKELRPEAAHFDRLYFAGFYGYGEAGTPTGSKNSAVVAPRRRPHVGEIADRERRTSLNGDLFQLSIRPITDELAVGRPEHYFCAFGSRERAGGQRVEALNPHHGTALSV